MRQYSFVYLFLMVFMVGCASMPSPETTSQKIAYAQAILNGLINTTASLKEQDRINRDEAIAIKETLSEAYIAIKAARSMLFTGKESDALNNLKLANKILIEMNRYLQERQRE